jgi:hypothetical protein
LRCEWIRQGRECGGDIEGRGEIKKNEKKKVKGKRKRKKEEKKEIKKEREGYFRHFTLYTARRSSQVSASSQNFFA